MTDPFVDLWASPDGMTTEELGADLYGDVDCDVGRVLLAERPRLCGHERVLSA